VLEALLPSALTKAAPASAKGTASGIYSSSQFIGIFFGGTIGGLAMQYGGAPAVFAFVLALTALWVLSQMIRQRSAA
jgi:predicted MFS family arabinose efflux permease